MGRTNLFTNSDNSSHKKSEKEGGVREMKKIFAIITALMFLGLGSAYAMPIVIDVGAAGISGTTTDDNTYTGAFSQINIYVQTTSTFTTYPGFQDAGDLVANQFVYTTTNSDSEGLGYGMGGGYAWEMTGYWTNLAGNVGIPTYYKDSLTLEEFWLVTYDYNSGNMILKADSEPNANFRTVGLAYDDDDHATFMDGTKVAGLTVLDGVGHLFFSYGFMSDMITPDLSNPISGDTLMFAKFDYMLTNFWRDTNLNDLKPFVDSIPGIWIESTFDTNTYNASLSADGTKIYSDHGGKMSIEVVPEPTSLLLLGSGLLGLAGAGFRRRKRIA